MKKITIDMLLHVLENSLIRVEGETDGVFITNIADVEHTNEQTLDWINPAKQDRQAIAEKTKAKVVLVDESVQYSKIAAEARKTFIYVQNPKLALVLIGNAFFVKKPTASIDKTSIIDSTAEIGENVYIGPYCIIGKAKIGNGTFISGNVRIYDNVVIGANCRIKEGVVIGGEGFSYVVDEENNRIRFPHIGGVIIGNNVDIGSNTCIDRGALSNTIIDDFVKIANLCQIAHNVHVGSNSMIVACSQISGSCKIGKNVWIGPNASIRDWRSIGDNTLIGIGSTVIQDIPENEVWAGTPAKFFRKR